MSELVLENTNELPDNWILTDIESICHDPQYGYTTSAKSGGDIKFLRTTDITSGQINWNTVPYCKKNPEDVEKYLLKNNDVVISRAGSIGYSYLIESPPKAVFASYLIRFNAIINSKFFSYFLQSPYYWKAISETKIGIAVQNVNATKLKQILIPISPLNEQKRIVDKIEELFSLIDSKMEQLDNIQKQIDTYEKSILFSAFNGILTHDWRLQHPEMKGDETLEKSLEKRHELWNEKQKSNKKPTKYIPPIRPSLSNLPKIPDMWTWASFEEISERVTVGFVSSMRNEYLETGIPFLRSQNVRKNRFDEKGLKFVSQEFHAKLSKSKLSPNDVVAVRSGDVGVSCVIPDTLKNSNCSDLLIVKNPLGINPHFGAYYLNSIRESRVRQQQVGIALTHFNTQSLAKLAIPIPHIEEQNILVENIQKTYSLIENIQKILKFSKLNLIGLKQSILKQAFEGKLVPQDPNDEPAEILLQKIKQEKEEYAEKIKQEKQQLKQKQKASRSKKNVK